MIVQSLRDAIAAHAARDRAAVAVAWLVWPYLHRLATRFTALVTRVQAGKVVVVVARATGRPRAGPLVQRPRPPGLPQGFAWLARLAPSILPLRSQVCHLLGDPELAALLAATPQAGRILRPLCRMLGIVAGEDFPSTLFDPPHPPRPPAQTLSAPDPPADSPSPAPEPQSPAPVRPLSRRLARRYRPVFRTLPA